MVLFEMLRITFGTANQSLCDLLLAEAMATVEKTKLMPALVVAWFACLLPPCLFFCLHYCAPSIANPKEHAEAQGTGSMAGTSQLCRTTDAEYHNIEHY
jgi:hypothetical protein